MQVNNVHNIMEVKALVKEQIQRGSVHEWDSMFFQTHDGVFLGQLHAVPGRNVTFTLTDSRDHIEFKDSAI